MFRHVVASIGNNQAYFPGTGGNVSLKVGDVMLIKASGKRIIHMNEKDGVVSLHHTPVISFFSNDVVNDEGEKESLKLINSLVRSGSTGRPSIETGFHTFLGTAVIHSHSAYVNMLTCSTSFEQLVETIFFGKDITYMCLPYAKPGYHLTHTLLSVAQHLSHRPRVFFMQNHGVIVSAETMEDAVALHEKINTYILRYFSLDHTHYPRSSLKHLGDAFSESATPFLHTFVREESHLFGSIEEHILFPDLSVFCDDVAIVEHFSNECTHKMTIERSTGKIRYMASNQEAHCIEENLVAYAFLMHYLKIHHLRPVFISKDAVGHIRNMEQERYRKMLLA